MNTRRLRTLNIAARESHPYVVLRENQVAYKAATKHLSNGMPSANLVVVRGDPGSGKSHLARQVARTLSAESNHDVGLCLTTGERLLEDLKRLNFAGKLHEALSIESRRNTDKLTPRTIVGIKVLICDDIDGIVKSAEGQRLLCVVIDQLQKAGGRVLLTAAETLFSSKKLSRRLLNRMQSGVQAALDPLGVSSRMKLLEQFCSVNHVPLDTTALRWLATELPATPRELWDASLELKQAKDRTRAAETIVQRSRASQPVSVERIAEVVSRLFEVEPEMLNSSRRLQSLVVPRQLAMYLAREMTDLKLTEIGKYFGNRNHSTVLHACRKLEQRITEDQRLRQQRARAIEALKPRVARVK